MGICEPMAPYDDVLKAELRNPMFTGEKEIIDTMKALISQGILQKKIRRLSKREIKYLREFDLIRFNDTRDLTFTGRKIKKEILDLRSELYHKLFYPK